MEIKNPVFNRFGGVDCEINHPDYGWIPFTARDDDPEEFGRMVYAASLEMGPSEYVPPPPPPPPSIEDQRARMVVSRLQARAALLQGGLLDKVEKAVNGGFLTGSAADALTRLAWNEATEFRRNSPTIAVLAGLLGLGPEALDELFTAAARIEF